MGARRSLIWICIASAGWAFSFGAGSQLNSHWLHAKGASSSVIGLNHSCYYLGLAVASLLVPWAIQRFGMRSAVWGLLLSGITLSVFPWMDGPLGWFILRGLNGALGALALIPLETIVSRDARPAERTRNFAYYAVALTLGGAIGIWAGLHLYEQLDAVAFPLSGAASVAAGILLCYGFRAAPPRATADRPAPLLWRRNLLSFGTAWYQGFLEGGMLAFLSLYLLTLEISADRAGALMGFTMVGVILFQVPVSWLADRLGRTPVLLGCYLVVALGLGAVPFLSAGIFLAGCLFLFGAASGAMYPLGLSLLGDRDMDAGIARAYAWYMAIECVGSQMGAAGMGLARDWWGDAAMFGVGLAAMGAVLIPWALLRQKKEGVTFLETRRAA